jgi:Family of unknown function (DUF5331)
MGDNMAFFYSFTDSLRHKWLQFFQVNRDWITLHMEVESVYTPDGGKRPPSYLILGVINALEPKLAQLMLPFAKLNPDADTLIEVLDLHFDPDMALGNRVMPKVEIQEDMDESEKVMEEKPHDETLMIHHVNGFGEEAIIHEFVMVDSDQEMLIPDELSQMPLSEISELPVSNVTENKFGDISFTNGQNSTNQTPSIDSVDDFGDISFDDLKDSDSKVSAATTPSANLGQNNLDDLDTPDENTFNDVLSDVWSEEKSASGEDLPSGIFDDSEIARLFPNA